MESKKVEEIEGGNYLEYRIPVTLRQVEDEKIILDSRMGCDDDKHDKMLDERGIFKMSLIIEGENSIQFDVLCLSSPLAEAIRGEDPLWMQCTGPQLDGSRRRWNEYQANVGRIETLFERLAPDVVARAEFINDNYWEDDYDEIIAEYDKTD